MTTQWIAIGIIVVAVVVALLAIRRYPLRLLRRKVLCPEWNVPARVTLERGEAGFGSFEVTGVAACSLFPLSDEPIACEKRCIR